MVIQFPLYEGIKSYFIRHPLLPHEGGEKERLTMWVGDVKCSNGQAVQPCRVVPHSKMQTSVSACS